MKLYNTLKNHFFYLKFLSKKTVLLLTIFTAANSVQYLAQPLILKFALNIPSSPSWGDLSHFILLGLLCYAWIYGLGLVFNLYSNYVINQKISVAISSSLLKKFLSAKNAARTDADKISNLSQDIDSYRDSWVFPHLQLAIWGSVVVVTAGYLIVTNWLLGILFAAGLFLVPIPQAFLNQKMMTTGKASLDARTKALAKIMDAIHGTTTLQNNGAVPHFLPLIVANIKEREIARNKMAYIYNYAYAFNGLTAFIGQILPLTLGFWMNMHGANISIAALISMYVASNQLSGPLQNMLYSFSSIQENEPMRERLESVLNEKNELEDTESKSQVIQNLSKLQLEKISKRFGEKEVFKNFSFWFEKGKKYLIRGSSGSGKTTLFKLINKNLPLDEGKITAVDSSERRYDDFSKNIGLITQDPFLFNDTLRFNLTLGQAFDDKKLLNILSLVGLEKEFKDILNIEVRNGGENISGGQRIRIEVARFLLRQKDILLVDEVTAALDNENARKVREVIYSLPVLLIEIAHHIESEAYFDGIVELNKS